MSYVLEAYMAECFYTAIIAIYTRECSISNYINLYYQNIAAGGAIKMYSISKILSSREVANAHYYIFYQ